MPDVTLGGDDTFSTTGTFNDTNYDVASTSTVAVGDAAAIAVPAGPFSVSAASVVVGCATRPPSPYYFEIDSAGVVTHPALQPTITTPVNGGDTVTVAISFAITPADWVASGLGAEDIVDAVAITYCTYDTTLGTDTLSVFENFSQPVNAALGPEWIVQIPPGSGVFADASMVLAAGVALSIDTSATMVLPTAGNVLRVYYDITAVQP